MALPAWATCRSLLDEHALNTTPTDETPSVARAFRLLPSPSQRCSSRPSTHHSKTTQRVLELLRDHVDNFAVNRELAYEFHKSSACVEHATAK